MQTSTVSVKCIDFFIDFFPILVAGANSGLAGAAPGLAPAWLRHCVQTRIEYKICLLVFKCISGCAPPYLQELIIAPNPSRELRQSSVRPLAVPLIHGAIAERAFGVAAPKLWNDLPQNLRDSSTLDVFKKNLKTHLFIRTFT